MFAQTFALGHFFQMNLNMENEQRRWKSVKVSYICVGCIGPLSTLALRETGIAGVRSQIFLSRNAIPTSSLVTASYNHNSWQVTMPPSGREPSSNVNEDYTNPAPARVESSTAMTPLAPSVEKAYYRKCIELKRRLNEVEGANDEAKIRRVRLDRGIMKMRLERAFLLDELRKRMEYNVDGSEGSGQEGMTTVCRI